MSTKRYLRRPIQALKRLLLQDLLHANGAMASMDTFESDGCQSLLRLKGGGHLYCGPLDHSRNNICGIPDGYLQPTLNYLLRNRFPHYDPSLAIRVGLMPRYKHPWLHRQHKNTLSEVRVPDSVRRELNEELKLRPDDQVLEAGSYLGLGTVKMAETVGQRGRVVSVEALPSAQETWHLNSQESQLSNTLLLPGALAGEGGEALINIGGAQSNSLLPNLVTEGQRLKVQTFTIGSVIMTTGLTPDLSSSPLMALNSQP